jgi:hypothetical protein
MEGARNHSPQRREEVLWFRLTCNGYRLRQESQGELKLELRSLQWRIST